MSVRELALEGAEAGVQQPFSVGGLACRAQGRTEVDTGKREGGMFRAAALLQDSHSLPTHFDGPRRLTAPPRRVSQRVQSAAEKDPGALLAAKHGHRPRELAVSVLQPARLGEHDARE